MKKAKDIRDYPPLVLFVEYAKSNGIPIGLSTLDQAYKEHPEYFPEEIAHRKRWDAVPEEVKKAYFDELREMHEDLYKDAPHKGKGLVFFATNPSANQEFSDFYQNRSEEEKKKETIIHDKHFKKYGIVNFKK